LSISDNPDSHTPFFDLTFATVTFLCQKILENLGFLKFIFKETQQNSPKYWHFELLNVGL